MSDHEINRRSQAQASGAAAGKLAGASVPAGFQDQAPPFAANWHRQLSEVTQVDFRQDAPELDKEEVKERHRIYCYLLMKLIYRFWNGNKRGPFGTYPQRANQIEFTQQSAPKQGYRGDMIANPEGSRVNWDRYLGHNIACIAVDGTGAIIDFDFNHNDFFRSTVEHAESRVVRRLFSLTAVFDGWKTGRRIDNRSKAFSLNDVTLYTSLESCAQCSGIMSLAGVRQIIYLQNDFTAYMIGNIMYNLANRVPTKDASGATKSLPGAPVPIPASRIGLSEFDLLNEKNIAFCNMLANPGKADPSPAFFISDDASFTDSAPSITSFLCTDDARAIFEQGTKKFDDFPLRFPTFRFPDHGPDHEKILTNQHCLKEARVFYEYADIEGYRGSPHKL